MTPEPHELRAASRIIAERWGFDVPPHRYPVLAGVLGRLGGSKGFAEGVLRLLRGEHHAEEAVLDVVTVPESYLFRHPGHFDLLREFASARFAAGQPCRVLSAGCAGGEEAWSAAAVLADLGCPTMHRASVTGWDVSPTRLTTARQGCYRPWAARIGLRGYEAHFRGDDQEVTVGDGLRPLVRFEQVNLISDVRRRRTPFEVIFFRNVSIYWELSVAHRVLRELLDCITADGILCAGPSDPVLSRGDGWLSSTERDVRVYRREGTVARPSHPAAIRSRPASSRNGNALVGSRPGQALALTRRLRDASRAKPVSARPLAARPIPAKPVSAKPAARSTHARSEAPPPIARRRTRPSRPPAFERGRDREAFSILTPEATSPPAAGAESSSRPSEEALTHVERLADAGRYAEALSRLEVEAGIDRIQAAFWRGILLMNLDRQDEAVASFRQCTFLEPDRVDYQHWLAVACEAVGRTAEAAAARRAAGVRDEP
ncbi:MAG: hypothetical protein OEY14_00105 [Myxococcales bacterium]|nr:hypothetical protein [Myxococcales bacterium]